MQRSDIQSKAQNIKQPFDRTDIRFFFSQIEMQMETAGVASQWQKRLLLQKALPPDLIEDVKDLLVLDQDQAGSHCYKDLVRSSKTAVS